LALLVEILESEYARRNSVNGSYSRRAFARDLGLPVSTLCNILAGRSGISPNRCRIVTDRLGLSPSVRDVVITEIESLHARAEYKRIKAKKKLIDRAGSATQKSALKQWSNGSILQCWNTGHSPARHEPF
jgi:plasmid maintenance system antidote protein VapI